MTWLMENPAAIIAGGVLAELALAVALLRSGRGMILALMAAAALATAGLLAAERYVVTDSEAVRQTLDQVAQTLLTNDVDQVLAFVDPHASDFRQHARSVLPQFKFQEAHIGGDVDLQFHRLTNPPSVTAEFFAHFRVQERHGNSFGHDQVVQRLRVELHRVDGRWLITDAQVVERRLQ
jgi:hypothetical protein